MAQRFYHVDAFTVVPFAGNPAVVCLLDGSASEAWMQQVAAEMNVSETAFLYRDGDGFQPAMVPPPPPRPRSIFVGTQPSPAPTLCAN